MAFIINVTIEVETDEELDNMIERLNKIEKDEGFQVDCEVDVV